MSRLERIKGYLLGGAVGDALGAPMESLGWSALKRNSVRAMSSITHKPKVSPTMRLTAEGRLRTLARGDPRNIDHIPSAIRPPLLRWLTLSTRPALSPYEGSPTPPLSIHIISVV